MELATPDAHKSRQLPCCQGGALIARAGLVDPDVQGQAAVERNVDRREGGAPVGEREPARVAMGQDVDPAICERLLPRRLLSGRRREPTVSREITQ